MSSFSRHVIILLHAMKREDAVALRDRISALSYLVADEEFEARGKTSREFPKTVERSRSQMTVCTPVASSTANTNAKRVGDLPTVHNSVEHALVTVKMFAGRRKREISKRSQQKKPRSNKEA